MLREETKSQSKVLVSSAVYQFQEVLDQIYGVLKSSSSEADLIDQELLFRREGNRPATVYIRT